MYFYIQMLAKLFIIIGSINYLSSVLLNTSFNNYLPKTIVPILIMIIGLSGLYVGFNRDYYLPFLGECAIPIKDINPLQKSDKTQTYKLTGLPNNTKVIYWAAEPSDVSIPDPFKAYGNYKNSGSDITNDSGELEINLETPGEYSVSKFGFPKRIKRHLHFRYELPKYRGMYSRVKTMYL